MSDETTDEASTIKVQETTTDEEETDEEQDIDAPEEMNFRHFGLPVYSYDGGEYALAASDDEADEAAAESILDGLWCFRARFIARHCPVDLDEQCIRAIEEMQGKLCESSGPIIRALLGDNLDQCIDAAIESDGRGQYLAPYDNEEQEGVDIYPGWDGNYAYRIN